MGETSQVTLNWKSHERALKDGIWRFFQSCFMLDTKLRCRGKELKAHKLILSLFSSVLKTKLEEGEEEEETFDGMKTTSGSRETGLVFVDISEMVEQRDDIELLVKFLYTGTVTVPRNRIQSLRNLAEKLDVEGLMKVIVDETKETEEKELRTRRTTKVKQKVEEETSDDDDDIWNDADNGCDDDVEDDSDGEAEISSNEKKRNVEQVTRVTRSNTKAKKAKTDNEKGETSEFDNSFTSDEDSDDSTKRKRKGKTKKKNVKKFTRNSQLLEDEYIFRPFDENDEFESDDDENVKPIRNLVEKQNEATANYVETKVSKTFGDVREDKFTFDESDDYDEQGEVYEMEKKRKLLPPRMNKKRSVKAKINFIRDRQIFRERISFMHCEVCDYKTRHQDLIKRHVRNQHVYTPRMQTYHCDTCGKTFRVKGMYDLHQLTHENPGEREQKCLKCDFKTSNMSSLKRHLARKHKVDAEGNTLEERYGCSQCEYRCVHPSQLREHVKNRHSNTPMYVCDECGYKSRGKAHLQLHINSVHREERNFMCEICGYSSKTKGTLTQHKAIHNNERKFQCETCGMKFNRESHLKTHVYVHDPNYKPFVCDVCGHKTNRKLSLQKHMRRHLPGRVDGRHGRKIGVRNSGNKSRTGNKVKVTAATATNVDTTLVQSSSSNSSSCAGPSVVVQPTQPTVDVQTQRYVANQSQPAMYNNTYGYQHNYGMWMCNF